MIKKKTVPDAVQVTFALPDEGRPVSLVADLNDWDPFAHPLRRRSNGMRSVAVKVAPGSVLRFRYLDAEGRFFDDPDRDHEEPNGYGGTHSIVLV